MLKNAKIWFIIALIIAAFVIAFFRMYDLMITKNKYYSTRLNEKIKRITYGSSAPRGRIFDRNGKVLVDNIGIKSISYSKIRGISVDEEIEIARILAEILELNRFPTDKEMRKFWVLTHMETAKMLITEKENDLYKKRKMTSDEIYNLKIERVSVDELNKYNDEDKEMIKIYYLMNIGYSHDVKIIKDSATEDEYAMVNERDLKGVKGELSWERTYPYGDVFRTFLGKVSSSSTGIPAEMADDYLKDGYSLNDRVGISYLEKEYESFLKGEKATYAINKDNSLSLIELGKKGNDLYLSIDIELQKEIEEILTEEIRAGKKLRNTEYYNHSYVIISDPNTGEILAMSGKQLLFDGKKEVSANDISTGIITNSYTMGSVVKGASMAVGFDQEIIKPNQKMVDGCIKLYLVPQKCSFERLGTVNDIKALAKSSNYYQFQIAIGLTGQKYKKNMKLNVSEKEFNIYRDMFGEFGLGKLTNIDLPNEKMGIKGTTIADDLLLNFSIGQYDTYTPIQLLQYINTIATGQRLAPSLMKKITTDDGLVIKTHEKKVLSELHLDEAYLERIREGFKQVLKTGTGKGYTNTKFKPAGKTGTSQSFLDADLDGKAEVETISSAYAMYAPYDDPKYSMVILSPNVSHKEGRTEYLASINYAISRRVSKYLFENY